MQHSSAHTVQILWAISHSDIFPIATLGKFVCISYCYFMLQHISFFSENTQDCNNHYFNSISNMNKAIIGNTSVCDVADDFSASYVMRELPLLLHKSTSVLKVQKFSRAGPRGRAREWATLGVHPLSWLLSNNRLEEVCGTLTKGTFSSRLLLSNQDKGCTPWCCSFSSSSSSSQFLLNLSSYFQIMQHTCSCWGLHCSPKCNF